MRWIIWKWEEVDERILNERNGKKRKRKGIAHGKKKKKKKKNYKQRVKTEDR